MEMSTRNSVDISIIIVTYNSARDIIPCLNSIAMQKGAYAVEVFVVDNASLDNTIEVVNSQFSDVTLIANEDNRGFPGANNQAITVSSGRYIILLNPDTVLLPGALQAMIAFMDRENKYGICGPMLVDEHGVVYPDLLDITPVRLTINIFKLDRLFRKNLPMQSQEAVSGACLVMRRELITQIGMLNEELFWCEDIDYCRRARDYGYQVCLVPAARVIHIGGQSAKTNTGLMLEKQYTSKITYLKKHTSPSELSVVLLILMVSLLMRYLKWLAISVMRPSEEAIIRKRTFLMLLSKVRVMHGASRDHQQADARACYRRQ
jgi:GT2 family glycosyltransferase